MRRIENLKDLRSERARLKLELSTAEEILKEDVEWIQKELRPAHIAGKILNHSLTSNRSGILDDGVRGAIDTFLKSVIMPKSGWIMKLVVPFIVKNIASNYVSEKKPEFFGMLKNLISKVRRSNNHNENHNHNNHDSYYDKSTVDEMRY